MPTILCGIDSILAVSSSICDSVGSPEGLFRNATLVTIFCIGNAALVTIGFWV